MIQVVVVMQWHLVSKSQRVMVQKSHRVMIPQSHRVMKQRIPLCLLCLRFLALK